MPHIHELNDYVVGAFIVRNGKVLMINHIKLGMWLCPGGHVELDEDPEQAIHREILEETGCEIELLGEKPPADDDFNKSLTRPRFLNIHKIEDKTFLKHKHIAMHFLARIIRGEPKLNEKEHKGIGWFSPEELDALDTRPNMRYYAKVAINEVTEFEKNEAFWKSMVGRR